MSSEDRAPVDGIPRDGVLSQAPGTMVFPLGELRRALAVGGVHPDWIATVVEMVEYAQKHREMEARAFAHNRPTPDEMERVSHFLRTCAAGDRMDHDVPPPRDVSLGRRLLGEERRQ